MTTTIPLYLAQDMAAVIRDLLEHTDPDGNDPEFKDQRDVLDEYERLVSGEQLPLLTGINEEETERRGNRMNANPIGLQDERESAEIVVAKLEEASKSVSARDWRGVARALISARRSLAEMNRECLANPAQESRHAVH